VNASNPGTSSAAESRSVWQPKLLVFVRWSQQLRDLAAAAAVVSSSLRSAYWLWLEDDDRAMATLRCTLEQTARLRTWHLKPAKAATLEPTPQLRQGTGWRAPACGGWLR
jgi:hypothetical protein